MKKLVFAIAVIMCAVSCSTPSFVSYSAKTEDLPYSIKALPMTSQLNVSETKVSATVTVGKNDVKKSKKMMEDWAVSEALKKIGGDILLEPRYEYDYKNNVLVSVTVSGYPATFSNFRPMTMEDAETINKLNAPSSETLVIIKDSDNK